MVQPQRIMIGKLYLENNAAGGKRIPAPPAASEPDFRQAGNIIAKLTVKGHSYPVVTIAFVRTTHITDKHRRPCFYTIHIVLELIYCLDSP